VSVKSYPHQDARRAPPKSRSREDRHLTTSYKYMAFLSGFLCAQPRTSTGTIELNAPAESFNEAIEKTKELAATLDLQGRARSHSAAFADTTSMRAAIVPEGVATPPSARPKGKPNRSGERAGRLGSYEPVPQMLTDDQQMELMSFFSEKAPSDQSERVLTAMVKGEQLLARRAFIYNEIYTLMWLAGVKDLPKALDVVLGKMIQDQCIVRDGNGFTVKFIGRNRIDNDLPRRETK
jgi:hypothetical protein